MTHRQHTLPSHGNVDEGSPQWLLTFADLLSLILTFFVLLYSMSALEIPKWESVTQSLAQQLNPSVERPVVHTTEDNSVEQVVVPKAVPLSYLSSIVLDKFKDSESLKKFFTTQRMSDRLVISLTGETSFYPDSTVLTPEALEALDILGRVLQTINNHIDIYGNTSHEFSGGDAFPSAWELSLARAVAVSLALRNNGYAYKITTFGRASAHASELVDVPEQKREWLTRRVDIIIRPTPAVE